MSEHRKNPKTNLQIYTQQHINFADKKGKKKKNNTGKAQNAGKELTQDKFKLKTKEREQKQSKNGKAAEQKTKQEKSNEIQHNCLRSQKFYKSEKNTGKTPNTQNKIFTTKNKLATNHKQKQTSDSITNNMHKTAEEKPQNCNSFPYHKGKKNSKHAGRKRNINY